MFSITYCCHRSVFLSRHYLNVCSMTARMYAERKNWPLEKVLVDLTFSRMPQIAMAAVVRKESWIESRRGSPSLATWQRPNGRGFFKSLRVAPFIAFWRGRLRLLQFWMPEAYPQHPLRSSLA